MYVKKLEKAYFYNSSQRDIIADIFWLTQKLYKSRNTILICCKDYENIKIIGDFLWAYRDDEFIPHSTEREEQVSVFRSSAGPPTHQEVLEIKKNWNPKPKLEIDIVLMKSSWRGG